MSLEHAQFPARRFPGLLELPLGGSVYELLEERYGARPSGTVEKIEVRLASGDEAGYLDVPPGSALLMIIRTTSDADGAPIEYSRDLFRGDRTRLIVRSGAAALTGSGRAEVVTLSPEQPPGGAPANSDNQDNSGLL